MPFLCISLSLLLFEQLLSFTFRMIAYEVYRFLPYRYHHTHLNNFHYYDLNLCIYLPPFCMSLLSWSSYLWSVSYLCIPLSPLLFEQLTLLPVKHVYLLSFFLYVLPAGPFPFPSLSALSARHTFTYLVLSPARRAAPQPATPFPKWLAAYLGRDITSRKGQFFRLITAERANTHSPPSTAPAQTPTHSRPCPVSQTHTLTHSPPCPPNAHILLPLPLPQQTQT